MKLQGRIPVEPLEDERLTNIERNLVVAVSEMRTPARSSFRLLGFAGAVAAVAIAGFVGWKLRGPGAPVASSEPQMIALIDTTVDLGDSEITSTKGTKADVTRVATKTSIKLDRGKLDLHVEHKPGRLFVVEAGDTVIEDIGTRFSVDYDGTNVEVRVTEGEVKVLRGGKDFRITATKAWTTEGGVTTIAVLDEKLAAAATGAQISMVDPDPSAAGTVTQTQTQTQTLPDVQSVGSGNNTGSAGSNAVGGSGRKPGKTNAKKAIEAIAIEEPVELSGITDSQAAITEYFKRANDASEKADNTRWLYSAAVLHHRARHDSTALTVLNGVLNRQGGRAKAYKASLWLKVRIECLQAFDDDCRRAADSYQRQFPDGVQAGVAQTILTEIAQQ